MLTPYFNLFAAQSFSAEQEDAAIRNNMTADLSFGHFDILGDFVRGRPEFLPHLQWLESLDAQELEKQVRVARQSSVLMTVVMLTGACNADCTICYTARRKKRNELSVEEIKRVMDETHALGSRLLYIPGEGEPTLDRGLFDILEHARMLGMDVIMFSNGVTFSNDAEAFRCWQLNSEEFVQRLAEYPVHIYHKLWSIDSDLLTEMMGISPSIYQFADVKVRDHTVRIPRGLELLLRHFPRHRVGIETVVERRNAKEIVSTIIPLVEQLGLKSYIEPILHAGRCCGVFDYDPPPDARQMLGKWLSRQNCRRVAYKVIVLGDGTLTYGMALNSQFLRQFHVDAEIGNIRDTISREGDLFRLLHTDQSLVWGRYQICGCICEELSAKFGSKRAGLSTGRQGLVPV